LSRCYLDTNFLYVHLRAPISAASGPVEDWRESVANQVATDGGVISALVLDELAYRLILAWLRDDGVGDPLTRYRAAQQPTMRAVRERLTATWQALDTLALELWHTDQTVVKRAQALMTQPGLSPRHAFHAAHALAAGCEAIASADQAWEQVADLVRVAP
jgi:predicted nucleic acid-binding protein